jgi:hypothetical protein
MNRKIIFRGKTKSTAGDTAGWVEGDLIQSISDQCFIRMKASGRHYEVDPATVGQCTDLIDENNKSVFEGDIVTDGEENHQIIWEADRSGWFMKNNAFWEPFNYHECPPIRKIGNIHDNPELMEVKSD